MRSIDCGIEAKIREVSDAIQLLRSLESNSFEELSIHKKLPIRYLFIQLVEASASICMRSLLGNLKVSSTPLAGRLVVLPVGVDTARYTSRGLKDQEDAVLHMGTS